MDIYFAAFALSTTQELADGAPHRSDAQEQEQRDFYTVDLRLQQGDIKARHIFQKEQAIDAM